SVVMSQTITVRSGLAEASRLPSGLNANPATMSLWPVRVKRSFHASRSQTFTPPRSQVPQASLLPSGLNAKESAARYELGMLKTSRPVVAFQILTGLQSADFLSVPASRVPSGLYTKGTAPTRLIGNVRSIRSVFTSQMVTGPFTVAEASCVPSGLNITLPSSSECGSVDFNWPVVMSQIFTVLSQLAEASRLPSGLN